MVRIPHLRVPFRITGSSAGVVEQNSIEEIKQCAIAVLRTPIGARIEVPEFGISRAELFSQVSPTPTADVYLEAIEEWEPRAQVAGTAVVEEMEKRVTIGLEAGGG